MPREVFPYYDDRALVSAFLADDVSFRPRTTNWLEWKENTLSFADGSGAAIVWFDTAGALMAQLHMDLGFYTVERLINHICEQLGVQDSGVQRDNGPMQGKDGAVTRESKLFFAGNPIGVGRPFVIMGALGIQAYRASLTTGVK